MSDAALARRAGEQHGMLTRGDARSTGMTDKQIDRRLAAGLLVAVHPGVYRHAAHPDSERSQLLAAVLACRDIAVVSHRSAARLHELRDVPRWRPEVTVIGSRLPGLQGVDVHRTKRLGTEDIAFVDRIPAVSVARCLLEISGQLPARAVRQAAQDALLRGVVTADSLASVLERLGGSGRPGTAVLRDALAAAPSAQLQSRLEADLLALIRAAVPEPPELQVKLVLPDGSVIYLDFAWPHRRLAVEADGRRWHATSADFERDLRRSRGINALQWRHLRYGWTDVHDRPEAVVEELRSAFSVGSTPVTGADPTMNARGQAVWNSPSWERMSQRRRSTDGLSSSLLT